MANDPMAEFAYAVAEETGLDPRVVYAWARLETGDNPASVTQYNYLNLRPDSADVGVTGESSGGFDQFGSEKNAVTSTKKRIEQPFIWNYLNPVLQAKGSAAEEISAIALSAWDGSGHYGGKGGPALQAEFKSLYGAKALGTHQSAGGSVGAISKAVSTITGQKSESITQQLTNAAGLGGLGSGIKSLAYQMFFGLIGVSLIVAGLALIAWALLQKVGAPGIIGMAQTQMRIGQASSRLSESTRASGVRERQADTRIAGQSAQRELSSRRLDVQEQTQRRQEERETANAA
jgi:hypothetical protein